MNIYRHYRNNWFSTHLITILEIRSSAGNDMVSHEILIVTMKHCCTITINVLKINAQHSTTQRLPCPRHLFIPPPLFVYKYTTQLAKTITSQLHCLVCMCIYIYTFPHRVYLGSQSELALYDTHSTRHKDNPFLNSTKQL